MTLSDWSCLMELHNEIKKEEYLDANYILCKLIVDRAFIHCISDREVYISTAKIFTLNTFLFRSFCYFMLLFISFSYALRFIKVHVAIRIFNNFLWKFILIYHFFLNSFIIVLQNPIIFY